MDTNNPESERQESLKELFETGWEGIYKITCQQCQATFYAARPHAHWCSYRCRNDAYIIRRKEWRRQAREKVCEHCGKEFQARRKDTRYCSNACKQACYRFRLS